MKRGLQLQRVTVAFTKEHRATIQKALQKLRDSGESYFNYDMSGESPFIRDASLFAAEMILENNSPGEALSKQAWEVGVSTHALERDVERLRKILRTLKPDRRKAKGRKASAA